MKDEALRYFRISRRVRSANTATNSQIIKHSRLTYSYRKRV